LNKFIINVVCQEFYLFIFAQVFVFVFLDHLGVLMLKINFKNNKEIYYFDEFPNKKYFEKQLLPQCQTCSKYFNIILNKKFKLLNEVQYTIL
jgi:hypothetical protein